MAYRGEEGVDLNSGTPTYCAGTLFVDNWRWSGSTFSCHDWQETTLSMCGGSC